MAIIKKTRKRLGLTQEQFGQLVGAHSRTIGTWEKKGTEPAGGVARICRVINKKARLPRPAQLQDWIETEGGQRALEKLLAGGEGKGAAATTSTAGAAGTDEELEEGAEVLA